MLQKKTYLVLSLTLIVVLWLLVSCGLTALGQTLPGKSKSAEKAMDTLTDRQVIAALGSLNAQDAHQAVEEVIRRGERMLPLLLRCKGKRRFFYGYGLGSHSSAFLMPIPESDREPNDGSFITVEVTALYLISAIYHQTLEFAQAPYLTDGKSVEFQRFNTDERVAKAWKSVATWVKLLKTEGIDSLRKHQKSPLSDSTVHFWGSP